MATLPRYQQRGIQFASLPDISVAPQQAAISGASSLDQAISRMTSYFEQQAVTEAKTAAYKYAAENPLTEEQVRGQLATKGKVTVDGAGRIFQQTYEKAQAAFLANTLLLQQEAEIAEQAGKIEAGMPVDLNTIQKDLKDRRDGAAALLMQIDPEVAVKFSQGLAKSGNTLLKLSSKKQAERLIAVQTQQFKYLVDSKLSFFAHELRQQVGEDYALTDAEIAAGKKPRQKTATDLATSHLARIEEQVRAANGLGLQYLPDVLNQQMTGIRKAMISVAAEQVTTAGGASNYREAIKKLDAGNLGRFSNMFTQELSPEERREVYALVKEHWGNDALAKQQERTEETQRDEDRARELFVTLYDPKSTPLEKQQARSELRTLSTMSQSQIEDLSDPSKKPGDEYLYGDLLLKIKLGQITEPSDLRNKAREAGMNGAQYTQLASQLAQGFNSDEAAAYQLLRRATGVPDVAGGYTSDKEKHKYSKYEILQKRFETSVQQFREDNPGMRIPYQQIASDAVKNYNEQEGADAVRNKALKELGNMAAALFDEGKIAKSVVFDADTDLDALAQRYPKLQPDDLDYLRKRIDILRRPIGGSTGNR